VTERPCEGLMWAPRTHVERGGDPRDSAGLRCMCHPRNRSTPSSLVSGDILVVARRRVRHLTHLDVVDFRMSHGDLHTYAAFLEINRTPKSGARDGISTCKKRLPAQGLLLSGCWSYTRPTSSSSSAGSSGWQ
jgi:hypothetical protein